MNRIIRHKQLIQLIVARAMELLREPGVLFWGIVFISLASIKTLLAFKGFEIFGKG